MKNKTLLKYQQFSDFLLEEIRKGVFKPGTKLPAERELGKIYNLAHMTVNKALNGMVTTGYLKRIQGYGTFVTDAVTAKKACLILDFKDDIHALFPAVIQHALSEAGYIVTTFDSNIISESPSLFRTHLSQAPDLLIFDGWFHFPFELLKCVPAQTRKIIFHRCEVKPVFDASYILVDVEQCGYLAVRQLIAAGKQHICVIGNPYVGKYNQINDFKRGCDKAFAENGMTCKKYFAQDDFTRDDLIDIFSGDNRCDGISAYYDSQLIPVIKKAQELKISIPEELALVGKHNTPWAEVYSLTSVDIQHQLVAEKIKLVLESDSNVKITVKPKLVVRRSCPTIKTIKKDSLLPEMVGII
jgi:DNA-binding LacI/PurR family transcriptional regulator